MTIHHSGCDEMQGKSGRVGDKSARGERLAMVITATPIAGGGVSPFIESVCNRAQFRFRIVISRS
jgi:hypothetical protein